MEEGREGQAARRLICIQTDRQTEREGWEMDGRTSDARTGGQCEDGTGRAGQGALAVAAAAGCSGVEAAAALASGGFGPGK